MTLTQEKLYVCIKTLSATNALKSNAGTVSGTTITFDGQSTLDSNSTGYSGATFDSNANKVVVSYYYTGTGVGYGITYSPAYTSTNLTATNFIGLASAAISDTAAGDINVKGGINEAQTGLTIGSDYYVQTDGTLATTADTPSVKVGQAISATTINMLDERPTSFEVSYFVLAGGGGGGFPSSSTQGHGGGGGGGHQIESGTLSVGTYTITVGAGGAGDTAGSDSSFNGLTSTGGGQGSDARTSPGGDGSSGGGGSAGSAGASVGGSGTSSQGFDGGDAQSSGSDGRGGGGGGAGAAGADATSSVAGDGGDGKNANAVTGTATLYGGGGGGGAASGTKGTGGSGGGGDGANSSTDPEDGDANTGGGGGGDGADRDVGANGGSGVVIIRTLVRAMATTGSPTLTADGDYTIYTYTASGSITF